MEVPKRYPLASMYQGPGDVLYYNSLARTSHSWFEWVSRLRPSKKPMLRTHYASPERAYSSVIPIRNVLGTPEEPIYYYPKEVPANSKWKSNSEHLKQPLTFHALPDSRMTDESKSCGLLNTNLVREITQKLLSICRLQHFCDLVCGLVNSVSASHNIFMMSNNALEVSESDNLKKGIDVEPENLLSGFCESVTAFDVGFCSATYQGDNKESVKIVNHTVLGAIEMNESGSLQKGSTIETENLVAVLCENMTEVKIESVEHCNISYQTSDKEGTATMNDLCHDNSPVGEMRSGKKNKLKNVDEEMVNRKQRRINKHSKKRKRRMRKKMSSAHSHKKGGTNKVHSSASSQVQCRSGFSSSGSRTVFHEWEDSDEDLCIVFDEVDSGCCLASGNVSAQSTIIEESGDLWIEFNSLTIFSGNSSTPVDCGSHTSEISIQYDSDSEYETDSGQIFVDTDEFDSVPGLVFLSDNIGGCSGLPSQPYVHYPSFASSATSYELANESVEMCEINKRWRAITSDVDGKPRLPQRVSFAPEEELVAVFPVDMIDRKSEWEQFALERFRFKRRIDEFEKIMAPYLTSTHREKTFRRLASMAS